MPKQVILPAVLITIFLLAAYSFTTSTTPRVLVDDTVVPFASIPSCGESEQVISMLEDGAIVCLKDSAIYALQSGIRSKIATTQKGESILNGTLGYFVGTTATTVTLYRVVQPLSLEKIFDFAINDQITPVYALFARGNNAFNVFISAQKEASSLDSEKSIHYRIIVPMGREDKAATPTLITLATRDMLRITDSYYNGEFTMLRELHPFLEPKFRFAMWEETPILLPLTPSIASFVTSSDIPRYLSNGGKIHTLSKDGTELETSITETSGTTLIQDRTGTIGFDDNFTTLLWHPNTNHSDPVTLLAHLPTAQLELTGRYSTRIGKRVYNCFDFSESLQITLRVCIPQL